MTNIQRAFCVVLSLIFLCIVAALPAEFFRYGEICRQLPLYCFLEKKAMGEESGRDLETELLLQEKNAQRLREEAEEENQRKQEELLRAEADAGKKETEKETEKAETQPREEKKSVNSRENSQENSKDSTADTKTAVRAKATHPPP